MIGQHTIAVIIPALNEAQTIGGVIRAIPHWVDRVIVADNGSSDGTATIAADLGADITRQEKRGYGRACLAGMSKLASKPFGALPDVLVFLDGDLSDDPSEMRLLVEPILNDGFDLVIGSRVLGPCEKGALTMPQRFGNWLSCWLIRRLFGVTYTDLGPFRAIKWSAIDQLKMDDPAYGWTVQMQVRAARHGMRVLEVPVRYRRRAGGKSKVSGTIRGVMGAGTTILYLILKEAAIEKLVPCQTFSDG
ncbi:MAG: glycosyltransferase family 2 protein [Myxococcota bacterium]|nr:glycosyltransferase family 2 protein [Myxococcota bacterium]